MDFTNSILGSIFDKFIPEPLLELILVAPWSISGHSGPFRGLFLNLLIELIP